WRHPPAARKRMDRTLRNRRHVARQTILPADITRQTLPAGRTRPHEAVDPCGDGAAEIEGGVNMKTAYAALLRLYPETWRGVFGREMTVVFDEAQTYFRTRGSRDYCLFLLAELGGLLRGAFFTWGEEYMLRARRKFLF